MDLFDHPVERALLDQGTGGLGLQHLGHQRIVLDAVT